MRRDQEWGVKVAADRAHGRLTVLEYDLGALPVSYRVMATPELDRLRLRQRLTYERRAADLSAYLREVAAEQGCHKVALRTTLGHLPYFLAAGFAVEAVVEGYYQGLETGVYMGLHLDAETVGAGSGRALAEPRQDEAVGAVEFRWQEGADGKWLASQERAVAGPTVRTIICLAGGVGSDSAEALSQAGYRYRGLLLRHELSRKGPRDLSVWVKSAAELG